MSKKKKRKAEKPSPEPTKPPSIQSRPSPLSSKHIAAIGLMAAITLVAYANTFHVSFQFDDAPNIVENLSVHLKSFSFQWLDQLIKQNSDSIRIFSYLTFALNYYFGGLQVFGYHLVNLLIHLSSGILLYGFLLLTLNLPSLKERYGSIAFPVALFSSLLFLCHPIQTQSVTYIVQRMASMAAMFYLLAMLLYVKGRLSSGRKRLLFWAGTALSYLLGLFSKENVAILPLFIGLYEFYFFQRFDLSPQGKKRLTYLIGSVLLVGVLIFFVGGTRYINAIIEGYQIRDFTLTERVLTQFRVVLYYVTLLVYPLPSRLNLDYDFPTSHGILDPPTTLLSILIVVGLLGYSLWSAKKRPLLSYFILWYLGNLIIESSVFPLEMVYEHRLYLPAIGLFVLFAIFVVKGWESIQERLRFRLRLRQYKTAELKKEERLRLKEDIAGGWRDYPLWGLFLVVMVLLVLATYERNTVWRDPITLWQDCVKKSPKKHRSHYNLAFNYYLMGRYQEALEAFKKSILLKPNDSDSYNNLGLVYKNMGSYPEAVEAYQKAIRIRPGFFRALNNLGVVYSKMGRYQEAVDVLKSAGRVKPDDVEIKNNLGVAYRKAGQYQDAIGVYNEALQLNPNDSEVYSNLGDTYYYLGKFHEAIEAFKQAIRLQPGSELSRYNLGVTYSALGNHQAAIDAYQEALKIKPNYAQARFNLALSYLMLKERDLALGQYQILKGIDRDRADKLLGLINSNR